MSTAQDEAIALLRRVDSGQVSDAMEEAGLSRSVLLSFRRFGAGMRPMVGPAFTMRQVRKPPGTPRDERRVRQLDVSSKLAQPGDVVVVATGATHDVATWGENHAFRCRQRGVEGILTDGAVRDAGAIDRSSFPVFCRALSPVKSLWDLETAEIGGAVSIDGVIVNPGDVVFADETGILVIPAASLIQTAERAHRIKNVEEARQGNLRQPG